MAPEWVAAHGRPLCLGIANLIMKSHAPARKELLSTSIQRALQHLLKPIHLERLLQRRPVAIGLSQLAIAAWPASRAALRLPSLALRWNRHATRSDRSNDALRLPWGDRQIKRQFAGTNRIGPGR